MKNPPTPTRVIVQGPRENRDPITQEPGAHPVGTGVGAATVGAVGGLLGTVVAGPVGGLAGIALGAAVGGSIGHSAGELANPTYLQIEPSLRSEFSRRAYAQGRSYEEFEDAYIFGATERQLLKKPWTEDLEGTLRGRWRTYQPATGATRLDWETAKPAIRDAWDAN